MLSAETTQGKLFEPNDPGIQRLLIGLSRGLLRFTGRGRVALLMRQEARENESPVDEGLHVYREGGFSSETVEKLRRVFMSGRFEPRDAERVKKRGPDGEDLVVETRPVDELEEKLFAPLLFDARQSLEIHSMVWVAERPGGEAGSAGYLEEPVRAFLTRARTHLKNLLRLGEEDFIATHAYRVDLEELASHAVSQALAQRHGYVGFEQLEQIAAISQVREEKARVTGQIILVEEPNLESAYVSFTKPGELSATKHIGKLLLGTSRKKRSEEEGGRLFLLVAEGQVWAIGRKRPDRGVQIDFVEGQGEVYLLEQSTRYHMCSLTAGEYHCRGNGVDLSGLAEVRPAGLKTATSLLDMKLLVETIVRKAISGAHGSMLIIDCGMESVEERQKVMRSAPGEWFTEPAPLRSSEGGLQDRFEALALAGCKMDGALYLDRYGNLHAMGCILEGTALDNEDRAYGARHRSAARYTNARSSAVAVTVSEDGHVSIFLEGEELGVTSTH